MSIQTAFESALLLYIQVEVDQLAEGIQSYEENRPHCWGHEDGDSCCCDTSVKIEVRYRVPREVNRFGWREWRYRGDFFELINMLDKMDKTPVDL